MRPLLVDLGGFLLLIVLSGTFLWLGMHLPSRSKSMRLAILTSVIGLILATGFFVIGWLPFGFGWIFFYLGGARVVVSWAALVLLGYVWKSPQGSFTPSFLQFLVGMGFLVLVIEASSRLWWRFRAEDLWARFPDSQGCLAQSSQQTCGPAATAMLLHHYKIQAGEGELAYLAGTSFFGTEGFGLAQALAAKIEDPGWSARVEKMDYEACLHSGNPFVAHIRSGVGGHALFVKAIGPEGVAIIDPGDGQQSQMSRQDFEAKWDGTVVRVVPGP